MAELNVPLKEMMATKKRRPRIEDTKNTLRLFIHNRLAFTGFIITMIYFLIALLDVVYPSWLGVSNITSMLNWIPGGSPTSALPTAPTTVGGWWYYLGTTYSLIPLFPVILASLEYDLGYSVLIVFSGLFIGLLLGTISGYFGGLIDEVVMRVTDVFFSFPTLVLAIAMSYVLGETMNTIIIALIIIWWPSYARFSRGLALTTRSQNFIEAATASGSSKLRNAFVHVMPNVLSPIYVQLSLDLGSVVGILATLDFIGFNKNGYLPELGNLIAQGQTFLADGTWWPVLVPGVFLLIFIVAVNLMGDGLRDVLDPKLRR